MATTSKRPRLLLSAEQQSFLMQTAQSRRRPQREVQRAQILLRYAQGQKITAISRALRVSRVAVYKWVDRALALGAEAALSDQFHRPKEPVITEQAKAWVVSFACTVSLPTSQPSIPRAWKPSRKAVSSSLRNSGPSVTRPQICHPDRADIHDWVVTLNTKGWGPYPFSRVWIYTTVTSRPRSIPGTAAGSLFSC